MGLKDHIIHCCCSQREFNFIFLWTRRNILSIFLIEIEIEIGGGSYFLLSCTGPDHQKSLPQFPKPLLELEWNLVLCLFGQWQLYIITPVKELAQIYTLPMIMAKQITCATSLCGIFKPSIFFQLCVCINGYKLCMQLF